MSARVHAHSSSSTLSPHQGRAGNEAHGRRMELLNNRVSRDMPLTDAEWAAWRQGLAKFSEATPVSVCMGLRMPVVSRPLHL